MGFRVQGCKGCKMRVIRAYYRGYKGYEDCSFVCPSPQSKVHVVEGERAGGGGGIGLQQLAACRKLQRNKNRSLRLGAMNGSRRAADATNPKP